MSGKLITRRRLLGLGAASASSLVLAGCDQFDWMGRNANVRDFLERANSVTYGVQRAVVGEGALAHEYAESEIRQPQRPNGSTDPRNLNPEYAALAETNFAGFRLAVTGLVETPLSLSLDELRNMPSRTQITRHDCVEGWSCIAKWQGVPVAALLDQCGPRADARYAVFHCYDRANLGRLSGPTAFYGSIDLIDARHPQTILAYGLNDQALPISNGAPLRLRVERQLGYKMSKYVHTIELVDSFAAIGDGNGGFWEDLGYDWYAGI
jgi:DMSO/TMAO reductase YedYZ molybdopterin-dependent catalytic subunit